jgi:hypothetical protein
MAKSAEQTDAGSSCWVGEGMSTTVVHQSFLRYF